MQLTKFSTLSRKSSFRIKVTNMQKNSTATERPFAKAWGISSTLILPRSLIWKSVKNQNTEMCQVGRLKYVTRFTKTELTKQYYNLRKDQKYILCRTWLVARQSRLNRLLLSDTTRYVNKT